MDPQERPLRFPFCECIALKEPCCSSTMLCFPKNVVIRRRVRWREPVLEVPSQLVTYKIPSVLVMKDSGTRTSHLVCFINHLVNSNYKPTRVSTGDTYPTRDTYPSRVELYPLIPCHLMKPILGKMYRQSCKHCAPSITVFIFPTRP
jgi:hypothetical protein